MFVQYDNDDNIEALYKTATKDNQQRCISRAAGV